MSSFIYKESKGIFSILKNISALYLNLKLNHSFMVNKLNNLKEIFIRKLNTILLQKEIQSLEKGSYLSLRERIELKRAISILSTLKQQPFNNGDDLIQQ